MAFVGGVSSRLLRPARPTRVGAGTRRASRRVSPRAAIKEAELGSSKISVTEVCLGTMTFGVQVDEAESHRLIDYAVRERGVNFLDTAEMYPVPMSDPRWKPGRTEEFIGSWLAKNRSLRDQLVIASKVTGYSSTSAILDSRNRVLGRNAAPGKVVRVDADSIRSACEASRQRLGVDTIDLYQIHWPDRYVPIFGESFYDPEQERPADDNVPIAEAVATMGELIQRGDIRAWGLGNDTPYGIAEALRACEAQGVPPPATIQNHHSLFDRRLEYGVTEMLRNYNISLLPWSVLAGGALTGKYLNNQRPKNSRYTLYKSFMSRFVTGKAMHLTTALNDIAASANLSLTSLMLAWCKAQWYIGSTIIGCTTMPQLQENIDAFEVELSRKQLRQIDEAFNRYPNVSVEG